MNIKFDGYDYMQNAIVRYGDCYLEGKHGEKQFLFPWPVSTWGSKRHVYRPIESNPAPICDTGTLKIPEGQNFISEKNDAYIAGDISACGSVGPQGDYKTMEEFAEKQLQQQKALTHDEGKPPLAYLPWEAIDQMALVQAYGHKKYSDFFNYKRGMEVGRNLSCAIRHIRDYMKGIDKDHESGINPLAHALCRLAFVLENLKDGTAIDDRYTSRKK